MRLSWVRAKFCGGETRLGSAAVIGFQGRQLSAGGTAVNDQPTVKDHGERLTI